MVVTIQKTAKKYKAQSVASIVAMVLGACTVVISPIVGLVIIVGAFGWFLIVKILIWWHHK